MANFYSIITNRGKELEAEALASGTKITLAKFVVGDGNGQATLPKPTQTKLVNEKYRGDIGELSVSPDQSTQMMAKIVLPPDVGGFTVREIGILTDAGELYAVANCAAIEKPVGGVSVNMQFRLAVSDTANITLNVATGDGLFLRIDQDLSEIRGRGALAQKAARESLAVVDASTRQKGLVQLNSATNSTSETQAATPAAVKAANDNANGRLEKNKNLSDVPDKPKARKNLELGTAATSNVQKSITDNTPNALMINGAWGLGASGVGMVDSDILSPTSIGNTFFNQGGGAANSHFGGYGTGIHLSYGSNRDNKQRLTANLFVDSTGNLSVEWLAVNKSDGAIVVKHIQKLYGPLNKPSAADVRAIPFFGQIAAGTNLNTLTEPGIWFNPANANASLALNYPSTQAGSLQVLQDAGVTQVYTEYSSGAGRQWRRGLYMGTWSAWRVVYDSGYKPTPDDVNAIAQDGCRVAGFVNGGQDAPYMRHTASNAVVRLMTSSTADARYITAMRLGSRATTASKPFMFEVPTGCVITGLDVSGDSNASVVAYYRPIQIYLNGAWLTVGAA